MTVIDFPSGRSRAAAARGAEHDPAPELPDDVFEVAVAVHQLIVQALRCEHFASNPEYLKGALEGAIGDLFGRGRERLAEAKFELVYGIDPYTFVDHAAAYAAA